MQTVKASEFKANCLALMDQVARTGEPILVRNAKPVAELRPATGRQRSKSPFGLHKGSVVITGNIISPLEAEWETP